MSTPTRPTRIFVPYNPLRGVERGNDDQFQGACLEALTKHHELLETLDPAIAQGLSSSKVSTQYWAINALFAHQLEGTRQVILACGRIDEMPRKVVARLQLDPLRRDPRLSNAERTQLINALWDAKHFLEGTTRNRRTGHHPQRRNEGTTKTGGKRASGQGGRRSAA